MKTLLAIALTVAALTIGTATVAPLAPATVGTGPAAAGRAQAVSSTAIAGGGGPLKWCGAAACAHRFGPQPSGTQSSGATDQHRGR